MTGDFAALRTKMVDGQLRTTDVTVASVLDALASVPREEFVPEPRRALAYIDEDIELAPGEGMPRRFLMEPSPFGKLVQLAEIGATDTVLDIGCGSGYSAAVLSQVAASVVAVEEDASLADAARAALARLGYPKAAVVSGPLAAGYPSKGPYDVIMLEGAVERVPTALFEQLKDGGRLVAVEGHGNAGIAKVYLKTGEVVSGRRAFNAAIKPLPGFERTPVFEF